MSRDSDLHCASVVEERIAHAPFFASPLGDNRQRVGGPRRQALKSAAACHDEVVWVTVCCVLLTKSKRAEVCDQIPRGKLCLQTVAEIGQETVAPGALAQYHCCRRQVRACPRRAMRPSPQPTPEAAERDHRRPSHPSAPSPWSTRRHELRGAIGRRGVGVRVGGRHHQTDEGRLTLAQVNGVFRRPVTVGRAPRR